ERRPGGYLINGQKTWCSNAHIADHILLIARTSTDGGKHDGLTQFMVPTHIDGLEIRGIDTMGGKEVNDLFCTDCFVPDSAVVGEVGHGWKQLMAGVNLERRIGAADMLGTPQRPVAAAAAYGKQREQSARPSGAFQALRHRRAGMAPERECARRLVAHVARTIDENPDKRFRREASMAKLKCTE